MLLPYFVLLLYVGDGWTTKDPVEFHTWCENATYKKCPSACPRTCEEPNPEICDKMCLKEGCECNPEYVLHNERCIKFEDCPGAKLCSVNQTFVPCTADCPTQYCPENDGRYGYVCDFPSPCPSGCVCKDNYRKLSFKNHKCILASECPPVTCTRPNEEWNSCPSVCLAQYCSDLYGEHQPSECQNDYPHYCNPQCVCKKNFYRNDTDDCVPAKECPQPVFECGYNEEAVKCRTICPPQNCDIAYKDYACTGTPKCEPGCDCIQGHLRNESGICIPSDSCFVPSPSCNDDNAIYTKCMPACTPTCKNPFPVCTDQCNGDGCSCDSGYVLHEGRCILFRECPGANECSTNQSYVPCAVGCPTNYCPINDLRVYPQCLPPYPCPPGCVCKENYLISNNDDRCILASDCPPVECTRENEEWDSCPSACLAEYCSDLDQNHEVSECSSDICRPRCVCKKGFYRNENDECVPAYKCHTRCKDENATYTKCMSACTPTCKNPMPICIDQCKGPGCSCNSGYVLHEGRCILLEECPVTEPECGLNEEFSPCKINCPPQTCESKYASYYCPQQDPDKCEPGCNCKPGYLRNADGICILSEECPGQCGTNEVWSSCVITCPPQSCDSIYTSYLCAQIEPKSCEPGCNCMDGYLRNSDGVCIPSEQCPGTSVKCKRKNEVWNSCPSPCLAEYCSDFYKTHDVSECDSNTCEPRCVCKKNMYRNKNNECVEARQCPKIVPVCGYNEEPVKCRAICPPQNCEIAYTEYMCPAQPKCEPGCNCIKDHLRNASGVCILNDLCEPPVTEPECGLNEEFSPCKINCPPQTCESKYAIYYCPEQGPDKCEPGCNCKPGYLRNADGICILSEECPGQCGTNEVWSSCVITCPPQSCDSIYTSYLCAQIEPKSCEPGCNCMDGYLRNSDGVCIPSEQCPGIPTCDLSDNCLPTCANPNPTNCRVSFARSAGCGCQEGYVLSEPGGTCVKIENCPQNQGCNGDTNAVIQNCPWSEPATCQSPNARYEGNCKAPGCVCAPGYILSDIGGKCILPDECLGGDPCGRNASYSDCGFRCPNQYCPEDDSLVKVACKPGRPCPPGCVCKSNYRRKSYDDDTCILASDCPPVKCTRPHEVWNSCPRCLAERCEDNNVANICDDIPGNNNCEPQCVCRKGYYRNSTGDCIRLKKCPKKCSVPEECRPTCAEPNPQNCDRAPAANTNKDGCRCMAGYVLSERRGKCIKIEECPTNIGCNGDEHAVIKQHPLPCPSTCKSPDATPCKKASLPVGCECAPGYLLSEKNRKCILPEECKGGNPCGENGTFVSSRYSCPSNYCPVDDSRNAVICDPTYPSLPGCACRLNYLRLSHEDPTCIASYECPQVNCTRQNEVWDSCPSACLAEYCEDVDNQPIVCNTLIFLCSPRCVCEKNYFRDSNDLCIPAQECREINKNKKCSD
ncbi:hypothetical protein K1T71_006766 [Dendrolimus kikuchii]|uniref:Uncharacterized protein n=1 Tax=Dendrolimus kikuchii TaxID=765133 RepID=A0ACC1D1S5_9NEOP|nr:hypothetical protein K1T71_006766 [Dendrolimus kikuchii]